jgi:anti-anti-sigma factor
MELNHLQEGEITIITIKGRLDAATAPVADNAIKKIMEEDYPRILFNLNDLEYLSSGGLRVILGVAKQLNRKGGKLVLCSHNQFVKEVFEVSGFDSLIPIEDTVDAGIKRLDDDTDFCNFGSDTTPKLCRNSERDCGNRGQQLA